MYYDYIEDIYKTQINSNVFANHITLDNGYNTSLPMYGTYFSRDSKPKVLWKTGW